MDEHISYSHIEQSLRHEYRDNINHAKSTEDVKKFFVYAVRELVEKALGGKVEMRYEDIQYDAGQKEHFNVSEHLLENQDFVEAWERSDLPHIVARLAETAHNHYMRLEKKHPDKSESKMYPKGDRVDRREGGH